MTHGEGGGRGGGRCARDTNEEGEVVKRFKVRVSECAEVLVGQQEEAVEEEEAHSRLAEGMGSRSRAGEGALVLTPSPYLGRHVASRYLPIWPM